MAKLCGLIPAAGKGTRAYPYTENIPKSMLEINGEPNLLRIIRIMRDDLHISDIFIVIGHQGHIIKKYFGDGTQFNVKLTYIQNDLIEKGLAYSIFFGKKFINDYFVVILSDECYINSNHAELLTCQYQNSLGVISVMEVTNKELIKKNYSVEAVNGEVIKLIEKPKLVQNNMLGCGTFVFNPGIFNHLEQAFTQNTYVDFITMINSLCQNGEVLKCFKLIGKYVNINDRDSLQLAKYYVRDYVWDSKLINLLIYSEGDEEDIVFSINQYKKSGTLHRIYVLLPHQSSIENEIRQCDVGIIKCPPGVVLYGEKIKYGLEKMPGDICIITEANYSFSYRDISKLLVYLKEADMVIGTRTTRQLIHQRSHMRGRVRMANIMLAKVMELLWWRYECRFSDVGCTFRALWKSTFNKIKDNLVTKGPQFSVEMIIEMLRARDRIIEIPVSYYGKSHSLYRKHQNLYTFFKMLHLILFRSMKHYFMD
ncbi:MAG TPA: sugar phosphate nucleotidyltransferase [Thermodesulfovibrionia bacterium]|nr:sugar phosphate nucleotidyltransferase [Thermodesulfovibrionia bacterium]